MKKVIIISLLLTLTSYAQTIYKVVPGSKNNLIILSIENESKETEIKDVRVRIVNQLPAINFTKTEATISGINGEERAEVEFNFDVSRNVDVEKVDTIRFAITYRSSVSNWKEILIGYTLPAEFKLEQNYPNPFNPVTTIEYQLPIDGRVSIKIFNILGEEIKTLVNETRQAGYYTEEFNGSSLSSGVYLYALFSENYKAIKKMVLIK
ncbi:MAG: T9SS type A sorting domain-containing protein [Melioribacteraceae bacterium]|nr:T9SS type A sorting domain-containing protein [Melioribacteraceae bacterium]